MTRAVAGGNASAVLIGSAPASTYDGTGRAKAEVALESRARAPAARNTRFRRVLDAVAENARRIDRSVLDLRSLERDGVTALWQRPEDIGAEVSRAGIIGVPEMS